MYSLFRQKESPGHLMREVPAAGASIVIAEMFYKFHSFSLECLAFLATWFALSLLAHTLAPLPRRSTE
jgi:hypothetical protein